ncbi:MAG: YiiX/YebB-like N1pC/P60 family cysteine hydrolase [Bryobacteraceae bacterium]
MVLQGQPRTEAAARISCTSPMASRLHAPMPRPRCILWCVACLLLGAAPVHEPPRQAAWPRLRDGDIALRRGRTWISLAVLMADRGSRYSHAGIVARIGGQLHVIHAEPDGSNPAQGAVKATPLEEFASPDEAEEIGFLRIREGMEGAARKAAESALQWVGKPFDPELDLASDARFYCTELVWKSYRKAGVDLTAGQRRSLVGLSDRGDLIAVSDLTGSPLLNQFFHSGKEPEAR